MARVYSFLGRLLVLTLAIAGLSIAGLVISALLDVEIHSLNFAVGWLCYAVYRQLFPEAA